MKNTNFALFQLFHWTQRPSSRNTNSQSMYLPPPKSKLTPKLSVIKLLPFPANNSKIKSQVSLRWEKPMRATDLIHFHPRRVSGRVLCWDSEPPLLERQVRDGGNVNDNTMFTSKNPGAAIPRGRGGGGREIKGTESRDRGDIFMSDSQGSPRSPRTRSRDIGN